MRRSRDGRIVSAGSEEGYRLLLRNIRAAVVVHGPDTRIVMSNPMAQEMLGLSEDQMLGKTAIDPVWHYLREDNSEMPPEEFPVSRTIASRSALKDAIIGVRRPDEDAATWVLVNTNPILDERGQVEEVVVTFVDITEQKRAEEALGRLNEELERRVLARTTEADKKGAALRDIQIALMNIVEDLNEKTAELESANAKLQELDLLKSMFIASMSHELRTPLNSIIGFSSILLNEWNGPLTAEQKKNLSAVLRSGKHLLSLINDIIDVSKIEAGRIESVAEDFDLASMAKEAVDSIRVETEKKGLELRVRVPSLILRADRRRILQCLLNLTSNAAKFTKGGSIEVSAELAEDGSSLALAVADTGIGIKEEDLGKLFSPFVRLAQGIENTIPGTGLGLYLTRKIANEILKGEISVTSTFGAGCRFALRLPVETIRRPI